MTYKLLVPVFTAAALAVAGTTAAGLTTEEPRSSKIELICEPIDFAYSNDEQAYLEPTDDQEAVLADPESAWTDEERLMIAKMVMAEAEGESLEGKCLVARVILNRIDSELFPEDVFSVISQKRQFSSYSNGRYESADPSDDAWKAVEMVCDENWDESEGALFFEATACKNTWASKNRPYLFTVGGHRFYS